MKMKFKSIAIIAISAVFFASCDKKESPTISLTELGYDNTKTVQQGTDLHIDAEILADLKIASIQIIIHSEEAHAAVSPMKIANNAQEVTEWAVDSIYTKGYAGVKNADFHEHLEVPATAELGHYHFHMKVTDMDGNQTIKEDEIEVLAGN